MNEHDLILKIRELTGTPSSDIETGPGDDAAVIRTQERMCVSVDASVEGVHFELRYIKPWGVGRRAAAAALSDLAAMGSDPQFALLDMGIRHGLDEDSILDVVRGFIEGCRENGAEVIGGNITSSSVLSLSTTVIGQMDGEPLLRSGARPGDILLVSGTLGGASLAVEILSRDACLDNEDTEKICRSYLIPNPRIRLASALKGLATSAIDISDGLAMDLAHIAHESGVGARVSLSKVPRDVSFDRIAFRFGPALEFLAARGEDYELLVTVPPDRVEEAMHKADEVDVNLTEIGEITEEHRGVLLTDPTGEPWKPSSSGWDHLS